MDAKEFKVWRERAGVTQQQIADKLGVSRTTIQNWEGAATPIPQAVDMSCKIWEARLMMLEVRRYVDALRGGL